MKQPLAILVILALLLYGASFGLPDHWWQGPVSQDDWQAPIPGPEVVRYLGPEMLASFTGGMRADCLDWAGWVAHALQGVALLLLLCRCDRLALTATVLALIFGVLRLSACMPNAFLGGYYVWLASIVLLGVAAFWGWRVTKRRELGKWGRRLQKLTMQLIALGAVGFAIWFLLFTGPRDVSAYPEAESSPYRLPYPAGTTYYCAQGNRAVVSHRSMDGGGVYAFDFAMRVGSDVVASRAGRVAAIRITADGFGRNNNNDILIDHGDRTFACYMHLMKGGSYVRVNDRVEQGQRIAASGNTGTSLGPHLHFMVLRLEPDGGWDTIPISFADVPTDRGIPRIFRWYTSGNRRADASP